MGGCVAVELLVRSPGFARGAVIDSGGAYFDPDVVIAAFARRGGSRAAWAVDRFLRGPDEESLRGFIRDCLPYYDPDGQPPLDNDAVEVLLERLRPWHRAIFRWFGDELPRWDRRPSLLAVECPILVARGGLDPIFPPDLTYALEFCPQARIFHSATAGHGVIRHATEGVLASARQLIGEVQS